MPFKPGQSGNPKGRTPKPKGAKQAQLREGLMQLVPEVIEVVNEAALGGDLTACKLLLDRAIPPLKAGEQAVPVALPDDGLLPQARAALAALSAGAIAPGQLASIMTALAGTACIYELTELEARVGALEAERDRES